MLLIEYSTQASDTGGLGVASSNLAAPTNKLPCL